MVKYEHLCSYKGKCVHGRIVFRNEEKVLRLRWFECFLKGKVRWHHHLTRKVLAHVCKPMPTENSCYLTCSSLHLHLGDRCSHSRSHSTLNSSLTKAVREGPAQLLKVRTKWSTSILILVNLFWFVEVMKWQVACCCRRIEFWKKWKSGSEMTGQLIFYIIATVF